MVRNKRQILLAHPGEILNAEFLKPLNMTGNQLAIALRVPSNRIYGIMDGSRGISAETALRLGRYFGTSAEFWMNLQQRYDLEGGERNQKPTLKRRSNQEAPELSLFMWLG
jgi:addiction module HigA family antidote